MTRVLSKEIWQAIYDALDTQQRRAFNEWRSSLDILASDVNNDVSFFMDWVNTKSRGLQPDAPRKAHELRQMIAEIPIFGK